MGLPWVRLDANIHSHDKILALLDDPSPKKWQATAVYMMSIGWSGGHETDGKVPRSALGQIHCTLPAARLLVKYRLWKEALAGWEIVNYGDYQQLSDETYTIRKSQAIGGKKGNCLRHHGPKCSKGIGGGPCWRDEA